MDDLISRQAAIDALWKALYEYEDKTEKQFQESDELDVGDWMQHRIFVQNMSDIDRQTILALPSAERDYKFNEWCTDCKEYDQERHCCPRFNHVIRTTLQEVQENRKKGKLLNANPVGECSVCGWLIDYRDEFNFCPKCGSDLRGEKDEKL